MPYCHRCGNKLEDDTHFCHKCGTPVATFIVPPPKPIHKDPMVILAFVLIAILVSSLVIVALIFFPMHRAEFGQTFQDSQPNVNTLNLNLQVDNAQVNIMTQQISNHNILFHVSGVGSRGLFDQADNPVQVFFSNETVNGVLTVTSKVTIEDQFFSRMDVLCTIYVNPALNLNLNVTAQNGQVSLTGQNQAKFTSLNLQATTGTVQANLENNTTITGNISLKTTTGALYYRMNQANIQDNTTVSLQSTTGSVSLDITQTRMPYGNLQVDTATTTGSLVIGLKIDGDVAARIASQAGLGGINTNFNGFSGNQSLLQSHNYPAQNNIEITNTVQGIGSININANYASPTTPIMRN